MWRREGPLLVMLLLKRWAGNDSDQLLGDACCSGHH